MEARISRRRFMASAATMAPVALAKPRMAQALASLADVTNTAAGAARKDAGVIDVSRSPFAKLKSVPVSAVEIREGFWSKRRATNVDASLPSMRDELVTHGRMTNFERLEDKSTEPQKGPVFSDSDVYKWAEAVGFALQSGDRPELRETTFVMVREIVGTQEPSGYLNTYFQGEHRAQRMQYDVQTWGHETYCLGHMLQGAIALYRATGDRTLLDAGIRFVDGFVLPNYGPGANQKGIVAGHPEIEMALVELYRTTGRREYLDLAGYILHGDPRIPLRPAQIQYLFCGVPFTSRTHLEGHAVRAMYACCGATDYYLETGDQAYWKTLNTLWEDLSQHQLYVTGGVGAREAGEAFGAPYELPNAQAYGESCAAIGMMMWNWRMLAASGDARFTDLIERALYNGINSGMSLDGKMYCYRNPLAFDPKSNAGDPFVTKGSLRNPWYDTTCCPPNLERTFAALPGYFYSTSDDGIYVHLYDNSAMRWRLQDGVGVRIEQTTRYPWEGEVTIAVSPAEAREFALHVRIPGWSEKTRVRVNSEEIGGVKAGAYLPIRRRWTAGDRVELSFEMTTRLLKANPAVDEDRGRVAFQRGPVVFCMEGLDQAERVEMAGFMAELGAETKAHYEDGLLNGVVVLEHPGAIVQNETAGLYYAAGTAGKTTRKPATLKLIPYYAWANREPSAMQVWVPYREG